MLQSLVLLKQDLFHLNRHSQDTPYALTHLPESRHQIRVRGCMITSHAGVIQNEFDIYDRSAKR